MELIYVYIDHYRIFDKQEFSLSNKFSVHYDADHEELDIKENKDYFDIYPENIVGISAIVGKNASGKTSLLSLIGDKVDVRLSNGEIKKREKENSYAGKINILNLQAGQESDTNYEYMCEYFLVYYWGKDEDNENLYVLETNNPKKYITIFEAPNILIVNPDQLDYHQGKGWLSCVFQGEGKTHKYLDCVNVVRGTKDEESIENRCAVIYFQKKFPQWFSTYNRLSEEEPKISIKKRYALLEERRKYRQIVMLQKMMIESGNTAMYRNEKYQVEVTLADGYTFFDITDENKKVKEFDAAEVILDYREYDLEGKTEPEKIVLDFLEKYTQHAFSTYVNRGFNQDSERKKQIYNELEKISEDYEGTPDTEVDNIIEVYFQQLEAIFADHGDKDYIIEGIRKATHTYWGFLEYSQEHHINYEYRPKKLVLDITKESKLELADSFFKELIDEPITSSEEQEISIFSGFFEVRIDNMSEGEEENLALFCSIWDQIEEIEPIKENYILLFDEIEKSMHPEMCRQLISNLISFLSGNCDKQKRFQIIIASHSPFIVGDLRKENVVCLTTDGQIMAREEQEESFGQNIHTLLRSQFFLSRTISEYAITLITMVERCLAGNAGGGKHSQAYHSLTEMRKIIDKELGDPNRYPYKQLPKTDEDTLKFLEDIIASIGEPLIRRSLEYDMACWKENNMSLDEKIAQLEKELQQLKEKKS